LSVNFFIMPPTSFGRGHKKYSFLFISSFKKIVFLAVDFFYGKYIIGWIDF